MKTETTIKVLEFFCEPLNFGGQEAFIINVYQKFTNKKISYTFCTPFECKNEKLKKIIKEKKDEIIYLNYEFETKFRKLNLIKAAKEILKNNKYDVIHIHSGSIFSLYSVAKLAKKSGIKKVIIHSHSTGVNSLKHSIIKKITNNKLEKYVDVFLACSEEAAKWKFPDEVILQKKYKIIKNGVDIDTFKFNNDKRQKIRNEYNIENKNVILNVGRFSKEKNQTFLIDIFNEIKRINSNTYLILIGGSGPLKEEIKNKIEENNLNQDVLILENINNVFEFLQAADTFVLPSIYEGFPVVAVEAQAAGLPIICSDSITKEACITPNCNFLSLNDDIDVWVKKISEDLKRKRTNYEDEIRNKGFDIKDTAKILENIYLKGDTDEKNKQ